MTFREAATAAGLEPLTGKQAIKHQYRQQIKERHGTRIVGSADLDERFKQTEPKANRWDYAVGFHSDNEFVIWIEAHPASSQHEVSKVIAKLSWLQSKLRQASFRSLAQLTDQAPMVHRFYWLYKGGCSFRRGGKEQKRLAQHGMALPKRLLEV